MRHVCLVFLVAVFGGCGAPTTEPAGAESADLIGFCNRPACSAAGGTCAGAFCAPGCEQAPINCSAQAPDIAKGDLPSGVSIYCNAVGNGYYDVYWTQAPPVQVGLGTVPPDGPWMLYPDDAASADMNGKQLSWGLSEYNYKFPYNWQCNQDGNHHPSCYAPTFVKVCAHPGKNQYTSQQGVCQGNLENPATQCTVFPVQLVDVVQGH
jgi:hypothetical protein